MKWKYLPTVVVDLWFTVGPWFCISISVRPMPWSWGFRARWSDPVAFLRLGPIWISVEW